MNSNLKQAIIHEIGVSPNGFIIDVLMGELAQEILFSNPVALERQLSDLVGQLSGEYRKPIQVRQIGKIEGLLMMLRVKLARHSGLLSQRRAMSNNEEPICSECGSKLVNGDHLRHVCYICFNCGTTSCCSESLDEVKPV